MPQEIDTAIDNEAETILPESTEPIADETAGEPDSTSKETTDKTETKTLTSEEAADLIKENNKLQMEINQRRNKEKENEDARKTAELAKLETEGKYEDLAKSLKDELEARTAADERKKADDFRNGIIDSYSADVAEKARALNLYWDEAPDYTAAESQLRAKLDILKSATPTSTAKEVTPQIDPNNPMSTEMGKDFDSLPLEEQLTQLRKELGRAQR